MIDNHDQTIAKIQHFKEKLKQDISDKEASALIFRNGSLKDLMIEISVYRKIADEYDEVFKNVLFTGD